MKLGEIKQATVKISMWGGVIEQIWLTKWGSTGHYRVLGLIRKPDGKAGGWCTLRDTKTLKECKRYAQQFLKS